VVVEEEEEEEGRESNLLTFVSPLEQVTSNLPTTELATHRGSARSRIILI
jgi:hypothetical protein